MAPSNGLLDFLRSPPAQGVIWVTVLVILSTLGVWVVLRFRGRAMDDATPSSDMLSKFREMHHGGHLDESEFRTIKTMLGAKLRDELEGPGSQGGTSPGAIPPRPENG